MSVYKSLLFFIVLISFSTFAEAQGKIGFSLDVSVSGLFSPELEAVVVKTVEADSAAQAAGVEAGDVVLSIDGCDIPGCSATKGQKLMKKKTGEVLPLLLKKADGREILAKVVLR